MLRCRRISDATAIQVLVTNPNLQPLQSTERQAPAFLQYSHGQTDTPHQASFHPPASTTDKRDLALSSRAPSQASCHLARSWMTNYRRNLSQDHDATVMRTKKKQSDKIQPATALPMRKFTSALSTLACARFISLPHFATPFHRFFQTTMTISGVCESPSFAAIKN